MQDVLDIRLTPQQIRRGYALVAVALAYFAVMASRQIALPGLYQDEVLFVNAATGGRYDGFVEKRILGVPVMLMQYIGALKAYLYFPIFALFGVSAETIRLPTILISFLTLGVAFAFARLTFRPAYSAVLVLLMAADPMFIFMSKADHGPIVVSTGDSVLGKHRRDFMGLCGKTAFTPRSMRHFPKRCTPPSREFNNAGQIIGTYLHHRPGSSDINDYDSEPAFLYYNGNFTQLDFPGAQIPFCCGAQTFPMDINNSRQVVGSTYNSEGKLQFFLLDDDEYFTIIGLPEDVVDYNGSWGINDKSEIAGTYVQRVPCETCGIEGEPGYKFTLFSFVATPKKSPKKHEPVN